MVVTAATAAAAVVVGVVSADDGGGSAGVAGVGGMLTLSPSNVGSVGRIVVGRTEDATVVCVVGASVVGGAVGDGDGGNVGATVGDLVVG